MIARSSRQSFDLFNTLVCTKNSDERAGDFPVEDLVPIVDNINLIQPQDYIISDFYDEAKATHIVRDILKLDNKLIVSEDGKATGKVWEQYHSEHHMGDNYQIDFIKPQEYGIDTSWTLLWKYYNNPVSKGLYLHQVERNFPFLLKIADILDDEYLDKYSNLLLCSRDCYLLSLLMKRIYYYRNIEYFQCNRLNRYKPTQEYLQYALPKITKDTLIFDLCGSGESLKLFTDQYGGNPMLACCLTDKVPSLIRGGLNECSNPGPDGNPIMIEAFNMCVSNYDYSNVQYSLKSAYDNMPDNRIDCLWSDHALETIEYEKLF